MLIKIMKTSPWTAYFLSRTREENLYYRYIIYTYYKNSISINTRNYNISNLLKNNLLFKY